MSDRDKVWRPDDNAGIGDVGGKIVSLTPEEYAKAVIERNADEAEDEDDDDDLEDDES